MPSKKLPGRVIGEGAKAFSSQSTPNGGRRVPFVDVGTGTNAGGVKGSASSTAPSGTRVPTWKK